MKPQLCIQESVTIIRADWGDASDVTGGQRWNSTLWTHPECTILYSRHVGVKRSNYEAVANCIMNALQDAGMGAGRLRYNRNALLHRPSRRKVKIPKGQERLF